MDEAGYGPNFGPLVIAATAWEVPEGWCDGDPWERWKSVISRSPCRQRRRFQIADSKAVYGSTTGLANLERSVLAALSLKHSSPRSFGHLWSDVDGQSHAERESEPWYRQCDLDLPHSCHGEKCGSIAAAWQTACAEEGVRLRAVACDIVAPLRFNRLNQENGSKGVTLSRASLRLLRRVWDPDSAEPVRIIADKHGGRNRYDGLLEEVIDGQMIFRQEEGRSLSRYRVGSTELRFQMKGEQHFPVAVASMVAKYIRELSMLLFNRYWQQHVPDLKPTAGYPQDARRFRAQIAAAQVELQIPDEILWRDR